MYYIKAKAICSEAESIIKRSLSVYEEDTLRKARYDLIRIRHKIKESIQDTFVFNDEEEVDSLLKLVYDHPYKSNRK